MDKSVQNKLEYLLMRLAENDLSDRQKEELSAFLEDHPERIRFAAKYLSVVNFMKSQKFAATRV